MKHRIIVSTDVFENGCDIACRLLMNENTEVSIQSGDPSYAQQFFQKHGADAIMVNLSSAKPENWKLNVDIPVIFIPSSSSIPVLSEIFSTVRV
jgi:hypothetical protein